MESLRSYSGQIWHFYIFDCHFWNVSLFLFVTTNHNESYFFVTAILIFVSSQPCIGNKANTVQNTLHVSWQV